MNQLALKPAYDWFASMGWKPHAFQQDVWSKYSSGFSGLLNAPTGSGKTYALVVPILLCSNPSGAKGLKAIWITPIRALAKEINIATQRAANGLDINWKIEQRTGDSSSAEKSRQRSTPPDMLITTPESLHILLAGKESAALLSGLECIVIDEWHELLGSKRGVQIELALSRLRSLNPTLRVWGISATIGNLTEAKTVLMGSALDSDLTCIVKADIDKKLEIHTIIPDEIETLPWAGHLGINMLEQVLPIIERAQSTLLFTNTRAQCEIWYQKLLEIKPELAGIMAMHHSSMSKEIRSWVEDALHSGELKVVVCTSSLDLGVDFRPVEAVIQIGSPKGIARFLQRAGRSGHRPGEVSSIWFLPTHSLELIEAAALKEAVFKGIMESRQPVVRAFDVLVQYIVTLAVGGGLNTEQTFAEVKKTFAYESLSENEWNQILLFTVTGGSLERYDSYHRLVKGKDGLYRIANKSMAMRHRMSIGTIVGDAALTVQYVGGKRLGNIEEWFIAQMNPGEAFWFAGRALELVRLKDNTVLVKKSANNKARVPSWMGGRMPLSSMLSDGIRDSISQYLEGRGEALEIQALKPLLEIQQQNSTLPNKNELLIECFESREGYHLLIYPFEGRFVHEGLAALIAYRISRVKPISFSIAMNDYGFELLSDQPIPIEDAISNGLFSSANLSLDISYSINESEMAKRRFRDIASIAGLVFKGFPGREKREKHLQSSTQLIFQVFQDYEPENLLFLQAYEEARYFQLEEVRLRACLSRILDQEIIIKYPGKFTPLAFPIIVDRLRARLSSEKLEDRIRKMKLQITKG